MGKGDMRGFGTTIGPHTPGWFGHSMPGDQSQTNSGRGQKVGVAQPKPKFTEAHQSQIDKLRIAINSANRQIASLAAQRDSDRAELLVILKQFGLPIDKYPEAENPKP